MRVRLLLTVIAACASAIAPAQGIAQQPADVAVHLTFQKKAAGAAPPSVVWLKPVGNTPALPFHPTGKYRLMQKNRMFVPHMLILPVGSVVDFPNEDPFFHNVFSLFDGKRFDLGLYEEGSSKQVTFSREGISYIFCNIHPEMSAVVIALTTPLYAVSDAHGTAVVHDVPPGTYRLHVWVQGLPGTVLSTAEQTVQVDGKRLELNPTAFPSSPSRTHTNEFGKSYADQPAREY